MATKKENRTAAEIIQDINELMGVIEIDGAFYSSISSYNEIQAEKPARMARRAQLAAEQAKQKIK